MKKMNHLLEELKIPGSEYESNYNLDAVENNISMSLDNKLLSIKLIIFIICLIKKN